MSSTRRANPLLDPFVPAASSWAIVAAASAGVFEVLGEDARSPTDIADELGLNAAGVERLMPVLVHLGYAETDDGRYRASVISREHLTAGSPHRLSNWVRFCRAQLLAMSHLESKLSSGRGVDLFSLFFYLTSAGRCHSQRQIQTALQQAGLDRFQVMQPEGPSLHSLYVVRKPKA